MLSRRSIIRGLASTIRGLASTAFAATGLERAGNAFADASPAIRPFTYQAPQGAVDDLAS
jgi:hypothetical protein